MLKCKAFQLKMQLVTGTRGFSVKLGGIISREKFRAVGLLAAVILCVCSGCTSRSPSSPHTSSSDSILLQDGKLLYELGRTNEAKGKLELVLAQTSDDRLKALAHHYLDLLQTGVRPDLKRDPRQPHCF